MKKVLNVLFSTTRQWNPGDEFILMGTINLLKRNLGVEINPIIYNRNPQIRPSYGKKDVIKKINNYQLNPEFQDNSIHLGMDTDFIDLAVFAGSPSWWGPRSKDFYTICLQNNIPTIYMGIGLGSSQDSTNFLKDYEKELLKKALFITTRDERTKNVLKEFDAKHIPCPAFYSSNSNSEVKKVKKIGLVYAMNKTAKANNIKSQAYEYLIELYRELLKKYKGVYEFEFIAHYIEEIPAFYKDFGNEETIKYSYDSKDYFDIYNNYDLVIGTRVHGVGIAASLGIPGIMVAHDVRAQTVKGFLGEIINSETSIEETLKLVEIKINNINKDSKEVIEHKMQVEKKYVKKIKGIKNKLCL